MRLSTTFIVIALAFSACSSETEKKQPVDQALAKQTLQTRPSERLDPSPTLQCSDLTRTHCISSKYCVLDKETGRESPLYVCRKPAGPCETKFANSGVCDAAAGCELKPGECYCHCREYGETLVKDGDEAPICECEFANGPPDMCVMKEESNVK
jgi:hypothetical protein